MFTYNTNREVVNRIKRVFLVVFWKKKPPNSGYFYSEYIRFVSNRIPLSLKIKLIFTFKLLSSYLISLYIIMI